MSRAVPPRDDVEAYPTMVEQLQAALDDAAPGDTVIVCRGTNHSCPAGSVGCRWCAQIIWRPGLTVEEILAEAQPQA